MSAQARLAANRAALTERLTARTAATATLENLRTQLEATDSTVTPEQVTTAVQARDAIDAEIDVLETAATELRAEIARDEAMERLARESDPALGARPQNRAILPGGDPATRTGAEPRTYTAQTAREGVSFFADLFAMSGMGGIARRDTIDRVERYQNEVQVEREMNQRATTTTSFAGLIPPQYLVDQYALLARAGRPTANIVQHFELPPTGMSLIIPRGTTGASAAVQATENSSVSSTDQVWGNVTLPVATIAAQQDVSRQSLDRSPIGIDSIIFADIAGAYGVVVDVQCLSGTGSSGQVLGILATSGVNQATAFTAAATTTTAYLKMAGQLSAIETTRFLAPTVIVMHPRRWNWFLGSVDSSGRPLVVPNVNGPFNALGSATAPPVDTPSTVPVGTMFGLPVVTDASIPTSVGTGPEDQIIIMRWQDVMLWENGDGTPQELRFEQTLGNQLTVKLVGYGYIAFTAGRYPTAVGIVGGNAGTAGFGLAAPTF